MQVQICVASEAMIYALGHMAWERGGQVRNRDVAQTWLYGKYQELGNASLRK